MGDPINETHAACLRAAMVTRLSDMGALRSTEVAEALRVVPRHVFAPESPLEQAYDPLATLWPKTDEQGTLTSTVSAAHLQAVMLEQARIGPGMHVLEIGSGGYNAALIAEIVGSGGEVTTVDIDTDVIDRARGCLDEAGYPRVRTVVGDGEHGVVDGAPFDRVVVTVRAWGIPPSWIEQLSPGGRLVVPVQLRGLTRSIAFDHTPAAAARLDGAEVRLCAFVAMQGLGAHSDQVVAVWQPGLPRIRVRTEPTPGEDLDGVAHGIARAVTGDPVVRWTGVEFDHVDDLDLWLGLHLARFAVLHADGELPGTEGSTSLTRAGAPTLLDAGGIAFRTKRPIPGTDRFETGVLAWGPDADVLAHVYADEVAAWGRYRAGGGAGPRVRVYTRPSRPRPGDGEVVLVKKHVSLVVSWPTD